jgi:branched-chain amino acid transport system substrate-binding protein
MKPKKLKYCIAASAALLVSALMLPAAASADGIEIGVITPLTETNAVQGQNILHSIQLAVNRINEGYEVPMQDGSTKKVGPGLLGGKIKLKVEDSESRPQSAVAAAHKLVNVDHVPIVLGNFASGVTVPVGQYTNKHDTINIAAGATSPKLREIGPYFFDAIGLDELMGKATGKFAMEDSGLKKFVSLVANNPFGVGMEITACKEIKSEGGECIAKLRYHMHKNNYRPIVQSLKKRLGSDTGVLLTAYGTESRLILRQAYQMGMKDKKNWYADYPTMWSNEVSDTPQIADGIKGISPGGHSDIYQDTYAKPYKKKYGDEPMTAFGAIAYDSVMLAALAVQKADSDDPDDIAKALYPVSKTYLGVSGDKTFDKDGMQATAKYVHNIYKDGKLQPYGK